MAYCPDCVSFKMECHVDPENYSLDCDRFQPQFKTCDVCGSQYDVLEGCTNCACAAEAEA